MWKCSCGHYILGNAEWCPAALTHQQATHEQVSPNRPDWLMALLATSELGMTPQEELYAKFYNEHKILVRDMDIAQLRENRETLSLIALEAKAKVVAADDELRERKATTSKRDWLVSDSQQPYDVSAAINVVKTRQARMSKMDKMRADLKKANLDDATINEMVRNLEAKATDSKLKTVTFHTPSVELKSIQIKADKPNGGEPFDPSSLKFGK